MDHPPKRSRAKFWVALFLLFAFVIPLFARIEMLSH